MKKTSQIVLDEYAGDIPRTYKELVKLPGIGPKMAHVCMQTAWNICTGIGKLFTLISVWVFLVFKNYIIRDSESGLIVQFRSCTLRSAHNNIVLQPRYN